MQVHLRIHDASLERIKTDPNRVTKFSGYSGGTAADLHRVSLLSSGNR